MPAAKPHENREGPDPPLPPGCALRAAQAGDQEAIRALVRSAHLDPTQLRWAQFAVITCAEEVVACAQLRHFPGAQELGSLVVAPAWRGRGLGAVLVVHLIARATAPLYLECEGGLVRFYRRFGFRRAPWHTLPWPLQLKFGITRIVATLFRGRVAIMHYPGAAVRQG